MLKHQTELRTDAPVARVFAAAARVLSAGRWEGALEPAGRESLPRPGCRYAGRYGGGRVMGQVVECLRPVTMLLRESRIESRQCVQLSLKFAVTPLADASLLRLQIRVELARTAFFRRRHWRRRAREECEAVVNALSAELGGLRDVRAHPVSETGAR